MWWIIVTFFILIIAYLIFAKFCIEIDSTVNLYRLSFGKFLNVNIVAINDSIQLESNIFGWKRRHDLNNVSKVENNHAVKKIPKKSRNKKSFHVYIKKVRFFIASFNIKKCVILIDTGSMPLNGILFPWFYLLSIYTKKKISINFWGENVIILQIENSIARMLWAYFKS